ncbi:hypothetical protein [Burkholderia sp. BCC0405]|nr:hypothetical protein [Burkholderia sp. BCC0405]
MGSLLARDAAIFGRECPLSIFRKAEGRWQFVRDANLVTLAH